MGYQLVAAALQPHWGRLLTTTERIVLVVMCQAAVDDESTGVPARTYWGGTDLIILQMTGDVPLKGSPEHRAGSERVRAALRKLESVGAVKRRRVATNGMRAEYILLPDAPQLPVEKAATTARERNRAPD